MAARLRLVTLGLCVIFTHTNGQKRTSDLAIEDHRQLHWKQPGACVVEFVETPCRTVRSHSSWSDGFFGFKIRTRLEEIDAFDQDGSESHTATGSSTRYWTLRRAFGMTGMVLRKQDRGVIIDRSRRMFEVHQPARKNWPYWEDDYPDCSHHMSHRAGGFTRVADTQIAGILVVGYKGKDAGGEEVTTYYAPSIGCEAMREELVTYGIFGLLISSSLHEVDSYSVARPDPSLFEIPQNYKRVTSILDGK